jgi:hypothetical protein
VTWGCYGPIALLTYFKNFRNRFFGVLTCNYLLRNHIACFRDNTIVGCLNHHFGSVACRGSNIQRVREKKYWWPVRQRLSLAQMPALIRNKSASVWPEILEQISAASGAKGLLFCRAICQRRIYCVPSGWTNISEAISPVDGTREVSVRAASLRAEPSPILSSQSVQLHLAEYSSLFFARSDEQFHLLEAC